MNHGIKWKSNLNRKQGHKVLMLKTMATQLIKHEAIITTIPKAKQLKYFAEKVVGLAKRGDLNARRQAAKIVKEEGVLKKLFDEFPERYKFRNGGYTSLVKIHHRNGDGSDLCRLFYVDSPPHKKVVERLFRVGEINEEEGDFETQKEKTFVDAEILENK